jgi:hypothetical protein
MCEDDLKPCPFCYASPSDILQNAWGIQCMECGASMPGQFTEARQKWNRRHLENNPVAYRYRWKIDGEWTKWRVSDASQKSSHLRDLEEVPLYLGGAP